MTDTIEIPQELQGSFKRMMRRIPIDLRNDRKLIETILAYLKLGGEKLAKQTLQALEETRKAEAAQRKKKAREEALIRAAEARANKEAEESEKEKDDDDDDDDEDDFEDDDFDDDDDDDDDDPPDPDLDVF